MKTVKVEIVGRRLSDSKKIRDLICGHTQEEPRGGKAHLAKFAVCRECGVDSPANEKAEKKVDTSCRVCGKESADDLCDACWLGPPQQAA